VSPSAQARPLVIAHRGASADLAEHTLGAYEQAIADGADGLECDVRLTADGHLVCVHDRTVDRTSDGRGVVSTLELAQLQDLDFASWKDGAGEAPDVVDERHRQVLTLSMLLELVLDHDRPLLLTIETKHPTRYAGWVEQRTVETLERYGLHRPRLGEPSPIRLMSFSVFALRRFGRAAPDIPRVALMDRVPVRFRDGSLPVGVEIAGPSIDIVRAHPNYPMRVRSFGRRVFCWTVDDDSDIDACVRAEVDAIITNRPRAVAERLDGLGVG
jgi:glycerophosphoryl diester phosphodiesterase